MEKTFLINELNLTMVGKESDAQVIIQFDESDYISLLPGTSSIVDDLDGNICVMNIDSFRNFVLKGMDLLSNVDPLFRGLLDGDTEDSEEEIIETVEKSPTIDQKSSDFALFATKNILWNTFFLAGIAPVVQEELRVVPRGQNSRKWKRKETEESPWAALVAPTS